MDGTVRDLTGRIIGQVSPDGKVWNISGEGVGLIASNGLVWDKVMQNIGEVSPEHGLIQDKSGDTIGKIEPDGTVLDANGFQVGTVSDAPTILIGAAGLLLLLNPGQAARPVTIRQ
jgi:hypothetical protein